MPQNRPPDPLDDLRGRLRATQEAAERLAGDAAAAARAAAQGHVPAAGWATAEDRALLRDELEEVTALLRALRELVPPELQGQVAEVLKQVLLLLRAILDFWVDRLDAVGDGASASAPRPSAHEAQDIPVS